MRYFILAALPLSLAACNSADTNEEAPAKDTTVATTINILAGDNFLTDAEKTEGWQLLFDGSTKNGFHIYNNKSDGHSWIIDNGTLHLDPSEMKDGETMGGGDIVTDSEFDNFHFKIEWKLADSGNSGIIFYIKEDPKYEHSWHTGMEMQVLDNAGHPDAKINKHRAADLYDLISSSPETVKKAGEWNLAEIISNNGALDFHLNGTKVLSTTLWDDNWKKMIKGSKFKDQKDFGTYKSGRIGLQDHGNKIWYRNIKIRKLS